MSLFGFMALHKYTIAEITTKGFFSCTGVTPYCSHWLRGFFGNTRRLRISRPKTREWWAITLRKYEIAASQLIKSLTEFNPNSLAISDFAGSWCCKLLYIFESVPNVATSKINQTSGVPLSCLSKGCHPNTKVRRMLATNGKSILCAKQFR